MNFQLFFQPSDYQLVNAAFLGKMLIDGLISKMYVYIKLMLQLVFSLETTHTKHWSQRKSKSTGVRGKGPYAIRTILSWTINGPLGRNETTRPCANFIRSDHGLNEQFQKFCDMEFNDSVFDSRLKMFVEDSRALRMMEVQLKNRHYQVALPWENFPSSLTNNRLLAEHHLNLSKRRLLKDSDLLAKYSEFIDNLLKKGYACKVPDSPIDHPTQPLWYLPHHPVFNPNKPNKVCVVPCRSTIN